ncbi:MAG: hypothetical protein C0394_05240, partial [Syntrophus sp. (in: bacteria)]|nr:hypothetical protein [Syntrophus sp. (in: bacteria)]
MKRTIMLPENEIRQRAEYCYLVYLQLSRLRDNILVTPDRYLAYLKRSTLRLAEDEFILSIVEEELKMGGHDGGLGYLIALFEGFAHAYGEVLEIPMEDIRDGISSDFREKLAAEMDRKLR